MHKSSGYMLLCCKLFVRNIPGPTHEWKTCVETNDCSSSYPCASVLYACMYICMCVYMYTLFMCMYMTVYVYAYVYVCTCMHACMHVGMYVGR